MWCVVEVSHIDAGDVEVGAGGADVDAEVLCVDDGDLGRRSRERWRQIKIELVTSAQIQSCHTQVTKH